MELGGRFWLGVLGIAIAGALGFLLVLEVIGRLWWSFGLLGMLIFLSVVLLLLGWISDRRARNRYKDLPA